MDQLIWIILSIPIMVISATVHEFAHAWVAYKLGDPTAKAEGRLTLNPIAHIDPIGFLFMIFARIGWAKPVPVDINNFEKPMVGQFLTAIAGPVSNLILMISAALILKIITLFVPNDTVAFAALYTFFSVFIVLNLSLAFFNLIPIPPLDGGNIVEAILPEDFRDQWRSIAKYMPIVLLAFVIPGSPLFAIFSSFWYNLIARTLEIVFNTLGI
jgi:Zn-dependent protease